MLALLGSMLSFVAPDYLNTFDNSIFETLLLANIIHYLYVVCSILHSTLVAPFFLMQLKGLKE